MYTELIYQYFSVCFLPVQRMAVFKQWQLGVQYVAGDVYKPQENRFCLAHSAWEATLGPMHSSS